jgi:hypothetical protein
MQPQMSRRLTGSTLLFAVEPDTDSHTRRLYFADEIPAHSDAGQEVHA